jgi:hypothetical protein
MSEPKLKITTRGGVVLTILVIALMFLADRFGHLLWF